MKVLNTQRKMVAYSLDEFKKLHDNLYLDKIDGYVITRIFNGKFQTKWVATEKEALQSIK